MKTHLIIITLVLGLACSILAGQAAPAVVDQPSTVLPEPSRLKKFMPSLHEEKLAEAKAGNIDFVMIGDSITHAWSRYPDAFKDTKLLNLGFPGDRTQNVLWRLQHGAVDGISPRLVTLLIGTNHMHKPKKGYTPDEPADIYTGIQAVVAELRARLPESKILVFSILPRKPGEENDRVHAVNKMLPRIADGRHVFHADINRVFLDDQGNHIAALYNRDGLHLNAAGYAAWAKALQPILKKEGLKINLNAPEVPVKRKGRKKERRAQKAAPPPKQQTGKSPSSKEQGGTTAGWEGTTSSFHGFEQIDFKFEGVDCKVVVPKKIADGKPWVWRARFWGHEPQFDMAMLERGYHVVYCHVGNLFGNKEAVERWNAFYDYLRFEHLFADRVVLYGVSRGGLIVYNWAAANPEKVATIYADAPVMDIKSWPGGKGDGKGATGAWKVCLKAHGLTEDEAMTFKGNPLDNLAPLAKAGIPIIHVVGDADDIVPVAENTAIAEQRYKELGGTFKVIHKPGVGHHPHSLKDPMPIVDFITQQDKGKGELPADKIVSDRNFILRGDYQNSRIQFEKNKRGHVAFLGGSITEMNGYRPMVCEMLEKRFPETEFTFTNAGISSTCSDTGAFRLQRDVLSQGPLDMLFVEFAVNDDQDGHQDFTKALRGMEGIIVQARKHNPKVDIVMTFFVNPNILSALQEGGSRPSIAAHGKVAEHHGISVNNLAQELADLISAGKMDWKKFGGVHPNTYGNTMCATMIAKALLGVWSNPLREDARPQDHPVKELLDEKSYVRGRLLPFSDVKTDEHWKVGVPDWPQENKGKVRPRFLQTPMIYSSTPHAKLKFQFTGTAIGAYILSGPDAGVLRCTVDGKQTRDIDTLYRYSGFNYPVTTLFFDGLEDGTHTFELEILENRPGRIKSGGTAFRAIAFTAN